MELVVRPFQSLPGEQPVEVVERKGLGHPDSICDGIAEQVSRALCQHYQQQFGQILHHNVDKVLLVGGAARARFGDGEVLEPIEIYLAGRATDQVRGKHVPVADIAVQACREWLRQNLRYLDVDRHVRIIPRLRSGSADLTSLFAREREAPLANDTSCGVGFAPLSALERTVLCVERGLTSAATRQQHPAWGEDVKVMGVRSRDHITLTVGCALVARHLESMTAYRAAKEAVTEHALALAREESGLSVQVQVNAGDDLARGEVFLTVLGTSAESGDDGEVGRGNRACGLITPYRPTTLEAAAGKNPVNHVGKLYNVAASRMAAELSASAPGITGATCVLVSQIGRSIQDPLLVDVGLAGPESDRASRAHVEAVVRAQLQRFPEIRAELLDQRFTVY